MPQHKASIDTQIAIAQVDALFNFVGVGVCGAASAAALLVATLGLLGFVEWRIGILWAAFITACAAAHAVLLIANRRGRDRDAHWQRWALWFTAIAFAEGVGWGWSPLGLPIGGRFDVELVVVMVTLGVGAGAVPCFSPYMPAFFALFLPATIPYAVATATANDPIRNATFLLMLIFMASMSGLAMASNRSFRQLVGLQLRTRELAADLQRQKEIAEQANIAKSAFLAAASHDLRQPIHALGLFVGALHGVSMPPEGRSMLEQLEISVDAMDQLFTALLDISRLDAGTVEVHRHPFAINKMIERIRNEYAVTALVKDVEIRAVPSTATVDSDPILLERVLRNLVSNAVRYTNSGRVLVGCRQRGALVSVQVWDTGIGIAADQQERVFDEYYQLGNPERDRTKGLGLGLAIVRRLTDLLGGGLKLRSRPGRGSCFEVEVPLAKEGAFVTDPVVEELAGAFEPALIVIIDDEVAILEAMSRLLTGWGHRVVASSCASDAIEQLLQLPARPDLIISDYRLRGENGIAAIERLRSEFNASIPAMLVTGDTAADRLAEAQRSGLLLLHKPVSNSKLRAAIVNLMRAAEADEPNEIETSPAM